MKVVVVDPSAFTPPYDHHLCEALTDAGCDVTLLTSAFDYAGWNDDRSYRKDERFYGLTDRLYPQRTASRRRLVIKGLEHVVNSITLLGYLKAIDPDVIHIQWFSLPVVDQLVVYGLRRIAPIVYTVHDSTPYHGVPSSSAQVWYSESLPRRFDRLIVHTDEGKTDLSERAIATSKIAIVPHGVLQDPTIQRSPGQSVDRHGGKRTVLFFGAIKHYKGVDILLRAFSRLPPRTRRRTKLKIAGSPSMTIDGLRELAVDLGIEQHVDWDLRYVPDEEVTQLFEAADIVAFPYRTANQSGALMTAIPYGKPIVASNVGGFARLLKNGTHGFLVEPEDPERFAVALETVLSDTSKRDQMANAVRTLSEGVCSWDAIAEETISVYEHAIADRT